MRLSVNEIVREIDRWKLEMISDHNDGWTKRCYEEMLERIRNALGERQQLDLDEEGNY